MEFTLLVEWSYGSSIYKGRTGKADSILSVSRDGYSCSDWPGLKLKDLF